MRFFISTEVHSIILMPQFLCFPSSYPGRLVSRNSTDSWYFFSIICQLPTPETLNSNSSRAEQSSSLLPATSQHGHSWHRAPLRPMAIYLFSVKTFVFFLFFFRCSSFDKMEGWAFFCNWCSLTTLIPPEVTLK
jgi:hypothetical protein